MLLKLSIAAFAALEIIFVPYFLESSKDGRTKKSQILKIICSTLFLAAGIIAAVIAENQTNYAKHIIIGLAICWIGDLFLHPKQKTPIFITGTVFFLAGHICYIWAYCRAIFTLFPQARFFDWREIIAFAVLAIAVAVALILMKPKLNATFVVGIPYALVIILMLIKAASLGIRIAASGAIKGSTACLLLILGALLFVISDVMLALNSLCKEGNSVIFRKISIITYYIAQFLIALTVFLVFA